MSADHMGFVGVSTASSSINAVFPLWARILDLPTDRLVGHDLPLDATREQYRELVAHIRDDPHHRGALVTTHKMNVFAAASDMFDDLDDFATSCREISSISKRGDRLIGQAKDPLTVSLALDDFLPRDHFARTGGELLVLGAGGSGTALTWAIAERDPSERPARVTVTALSDSELDHLRAVHERRGTPPELIRYVRITTDADTAALVAALPPASVVVNATGLGKDRPGSPLPDDVVFPQGGKVWEFNYRGSLEFLHQARARAESRGLEVVDGWRYFIHGWSQVVADVFDLRLTPDLVDRLAEAAETTR
ncbi:shikimate dehydrogenase family protein [Microbacterium aureliae]